MTALVLKFLLVVLVLYLFVTQIIVPLATKRTLFPMFRKQKHELENQLAEINDEIDEIALKNEIKLKKQKLRKGKS